MVAIVSIGDEVLYGFTPNSNAAFLSQFLVNHGIFPEEQRTVGDNPQTFQKAISDLLDQKWVVITTGGLGPTCDDHTRMVAAALFSRKLVHHQSCEDALIARYGKELTTLQDQSIWPEGALLFPNSTGTAFGFCLEEGDRKLICLPGPPLEMRPMVEKNLLRLLPSQRQEVLYPLHLAGIYEHEVDPFLRVLMREYPDIQLGIYPAFGTLSVHVRALKCLEEQARKVFTEIQKRFQEFVYEKTIEEAVVSRLLEKNLTISCAESCTGGALSAKFTAIPGVSQVFVGSVVSYSNEIKENVLGVQKCTLEQYGAVSEETTLEMATGARKSLGSSIAISVSGFLGPTGGTKEKPVGTVCYSIVSPQRTVSGTQHFKGDRLMLREKAVQFLLIELWKMVHRN